MFATTELRAEEPETPAKLHTEAKRYLHEGVRAYEAGRYRDAIELFLAANRILPSPAHSYNVAKAYEKMGDTGGALSWYRDYLRRAPAADDREDVRKIIRSLEKTLTARGVQQVSVASVPPGATVLIDGQPMGVTPWTGELPPGSHTATLQLRGYHDISKRFELRPDRALDVSLALQSEDNPEEQEPEPANLQTPAERRRPELSKPRAPPASDRRPAPAGISIMTWATLGAGVAALGASAGFEALRREAEDEARNHPTQLGALETYQTMESHQLTSRILLGVGSAAIVTGTLLLYFDLARGADAASVALVEPSKGRMGFSEMRANQNSVGVWLGCSRGLCGAFGTGRF
jgi:tetratricopeptide (TPR) repeat protein